MTTHAPIQTTAHNAPQGERKNYLNCTTGFWSWASTLDHKRIGVMYLVGTSLAFLAGGLFALLIRLHLWKPEGALFDNATYNQVFTLHGVFMVFMFIIPAIPGSPG
jgi:cytochrome c oxidase subunit 1